MDGGGAKADMANCSGHWSAAWSSTLRGLAGRSQLGRRIPGLRGPPRVVLETQVGAGLARR